jgi:hypothetical protein
MRKIIKEPFAPKRRNLNKTRHCLEWRSLFANVSLDFSKAPSKIIRERLSLSRFYFHFLSRLLDSNRPTDGTYTNSRDRFVNADGRSFFE